MTIAEAERFYEQDLKKYEIKKNREFLKWLKKVMDDGYKCYIKTNELQELIDAIANWYEIKYPERELELSQGIKNMEFEDIKSIASTMDIRQLLFRLPHSQLCLMECNYRAKGWCQHPIYEGNKVLGYEPRIVIRIDKKNLGDDDIPDTYFLLHANHYTGEVVKDMDLEEYVNTDKKIKLEELLELFDKDYSDDLEYQELKESILNHMYDMKLRYKILVFINYFSIYPLIDLVYISSVIV